jgi:hypothetical protein
MIPLIEVMSVNDFRFHCGLLKQLNKFWLDLGVDSPEDFKEANEFSQQNASRPVDTIRNEGHSRKQCQRLNLFARGEDCRLLASADLFRLHLAQ